MGIRYRYAIEETLSPPTHTQQLLTPLRESIIEKPPYISGKLQLPASCFSLLYRLTKDGHAARHINLANATPNELEQLTQACEPASFGVKKEDVLDETYRKAGKLDSEFFAPGLDPVHTDLLKIIRGYLLEGTQSMKNIKIELYKLNVYGKGSFFKPHIDTPRSEKMFGSLVIVFPTPHKGGALLLRHRGHEWTFDSGQELAAERQPTIGYVAFFSDIEHEVAPVISGHRITLTFNLYFDDDGLVFANDTVPEHLSPPVTRASNEDAFRKAFNSLLVNPEFLGDGGTLAFGLRHAYPIKNSLKHIYNALKGSDAVVYQSVRALGFQPVLYMYYETDNWGLEGVLIDKPVDFSTLDYEDDFTGVAQTVSEKGGIVVDQECWEGCNDGEVPKETLQWVTPPTTLNRKGCAFATYGNSPTLNVVYGDVCLVVRIGKAGERLAYPRVLDSDTDSDTDSDKDEEACSSEGLPLADIGRERSYRYGRGVCTTSRDYGDP